MSARSSPDPARPDPSTTPETDPPEATPPEERALAELRAQIAGEIERGIQIWDDPEWNRAARAFLAGGEPPAARPPAPPASRASRPVVAASAPAGAPPPRGTTGPTPAARPRKALPTFPPPPEAEGREADWEARLEALAAEARACTRCPLHETRQNVVVNSGTGRVPLVFVGEAPGAEEDAQGIAFVGRAGQLLTKIIAAIGLDREDVYICNVLKCRPPGNRNPQLEEITACTPYLERQIEILKPRAICTMGLFAAQFLLDSKAPIGRLRGRVFRYRGIPLVPTYHPAYLLRSPNMKKVVWEDVQLLRKVLDEGPPAAKLVTEDVPAPAGRTPPGPVSGELFG